MSDRAGKFERWLKTVVCRGEDWGLVVRGASLWGLEI